MKVNIKLFANFREVTRKKDVGLEVQGTTIKDAIDALVAQYPDLGPLMLQDGKVKPYVNVLLNGQSMKDTAAKIKEGDELALFPPVSGG